MPAPTRVRCEECGKTFYTGRTVNECFRCGAVVYYPGYGPPSMTKAGMVVGAEIAEDYFDGGLIGGIIGALLGGFVGALLDSGDD